jgi:hypothetical protein
MPGPTGNGVIDFDTYVTATPPPTPPVPPKMINGGDKKFGPPKPKSLGGTSNSNHGDPSTYFE